MVRIRDLVIGTAGHIDHGKSTLVRRLTGVEPDRWEEEKRRGMTIDLGFAPFEMPDGSLVGIVDVPGHERFIRNMLAGATGFRVALLVVAADDGVMPQTREHLDILRFVGVRRGVVAINKCDLAGDELAQVAAAETRDLLEPTPLAGSPVLCVSGETGDGIEDLRAALVEAVEGAGERPARGAFRLPVQRVFSKAGFGTVLTGIPVSGEVADGDRLEVLPGGARSKVRGIQAYGRSIDRARAGHSTALNLSDVEVEGTTRGCVACSPGAFRAEARWDVRLSHLPGAPVLKNRARVRVHAGTTEVLGTVLLLDARDLRDGQSGLARLALREPMVAAPGDPFVLRRESPLVTWGGGVVLGAAAGRARQVVEDLGLREAALEQSQDGDVGPLAVDGLRRLGDGLHDVARVALEVGLGQGETEEALAASDEAAASDGRWVHRGVLGAAVARLEQALSEWFDAHGHLRTAPGRTVMDAARLEGPYGDCVVAACGTIAMEAGGRMVLAGREAAVDPETAARADAAEQALQEGGAAPPSPDELADLAGCSAAEMDRALESLCESGRAVRAAAGWVFHAEVVERAEGLIRTNIAEHGELDLPTLRDALGTSRKYLLPLLDHFDRSGVTVRSGGSRILKRT